MNDIVLGIVMMYAGPGYCSLFKLVAGRLVVGIFWRVFRLFLALKRSVSYTALNKAELIGDIFLKCAAGSGELAALFKYDYLVAEGKELAALGIVEYYIKLSRIVGGDIFYKALAHILLKCFAV